MKFPDVGNEMVISLTVWRTAKTQVQTTKKARKSDAGPPSLKFFPLEMKRPAPICPPREMT